MNYYNKLNKILLSLEKMKKIRKNALNLAFSTGLPPTEQLIKGKISAYRYTQKIPTYLGRAPVFSAFAQKYFGITMALDNNQVAISTTLIGAQ